MSGSAWAKAPPTHGAEFTAVTRNQTTGTRFPAIGDATVQGVVDGERGRLEYLKSGLGSLPQGTVLITDDGAKTRKLYNARDHSCGDALAPTAQAAAPVYQHLKVDKILDEPGPKMHGVPTRHLRYSIAYDLTSGSGASAQSHPGTIATEVWVAPSLTDPAFALWLTSSPHTGNADADRQLADTMKDFPGAALKRIQQTTLNLGEGKQQNATSTMEVTHLVRHRPDAKALAPPFECRMPTPKQ